MIVVETLGGGGGSNNLQNICRIRFFHWRWELEINNIRGKKKKKSGKRKKRRKMLYGNNSMWLPREVSCSKEDPSGCRDDLCYRGLQTLSTPPCPLCLPWYAFAGVWAASLSLHGVLAGFPRSLRAIYEDGLWCRFSQALKHMLKGFADLDAELSAGSLHLLWLTDCLALQVLRDAPAIESWPLSSLQHWKWGRHASLASAGMSFLC